MGAAPVRPQGATRDEENRGASPTELDARPADSDACTPRRRSGAGPAGRQSARARTRSSPQRRRRLRLQPERPAVRSPAHCRQHSGEIAADSLQARGRRRRRPRSRTGSGTRRAAGRAGRRARPSPQDRSRGTPAVDSPRMAGALVTTVVGSYPQPDWLIDRERLGDRLPPRVRARELWRVPERSWRPRRTMPPGSPSRAAGAQAWT